jgi:predicted ATPase
MHVEITIKNYRCFPDSRPARFVLRSGLTSFVGVNNSGKSSLLKFFYEFRDLFRILSSPSGNFIHALNRQRQSFNFALSVLDKDEVFSNRNNRDIELRLTFFEHAAKGTHGITRFAEEISIAVPRGTSTWTAELNATDGPVEGEIVNFAETVLNERHGGRVEMSPLFVACRELSRTLYIGPFRNAINVGANQNYFDIQVGQAFIETWRNFKTGNVKRVNEAAYGLTEDIKRIFEFGDLEINPSPDNQTLQVFVNGRSYKLPELGSGLTQFILVLANAATQRPSLILIDEPELNLHPTLQLDFLTTLSSYAREGILFGTHNIGLARAGADWVYSLRQIQEGESEVRELECTPRLSEFLGELCFSGYREIGFNKVLLVEGRTDVKTVQQFLRQYKKDHQIVILPLGGSQLINESCETELQEIKRISEDVFALIDSERDSADAALSEARAAFLELCKSVHITCHALDRRAIENYFSDDAVKRVMGDKYKALGPFDKLKDASPCWAKEENWRIAREMSLTDLKETDLGRFLALI